MKCIHGEWLTAMCPACTGEPRAEPPQPSQAMREYGEDMDALRKVLTASPSTESRLSTALELLREQLPHMPAHDITCAAWTVNPIKMDESRCNCWQGRVRAFLRSGKGEK